MARLQTTGIASFAEGAPADAQDFITAHTVKGTAPELATTHYRRTTLRMLFRTLRELGLAVGDPTLHVPLPPPGELTGLGGRRQLPDVLCFALLHNATNDYRGPGSGSTTGHPQVADRSLIMSNGRPGWATRTAPTRGHLLPCLSSPRPATGTTSRPASGTCGWSPLSLRARGSSPPSSGRARCPVAIVRGRVVCVAVELGTSCLRDTGPLRGDAEERPVPEHARNPLVQLCHGALTVSGSAGMVASMKSSEANGSTGALLTRLPGRARPRREVRAQFDEGLARARKRLPEALWPVLLRKPEETYRWRVRLDCGCVEETWTHGKDRYPDDVQHRDAFGHEWLPPAEMICHTDHEVLRPYREIVEWLDHEIREYPPDPEDDPYGVLDAETWARVRRTTPHQSARWTVKLSCGHHDDAVPTRVGWRPEDGPRRSTEERTAQMRQEFEEYWAEHPDCDAHEEIERAHYRAMLDQRWPIPDPQRSCYMCTRARRITGYQRIGWLVPRPRPVPPPQTEREQLQARLEAAKAHTRQLQARLESIDREAPR